MRLDERALIRSDVVFDDDGLKSRLARQLIAPNFVENVLNRKVKTIGDLLRIGVEIAHLVAQQQRGE